uniref:Uncharacterized protein n=1 Tax=Rhizophagus irregularis (strain DAOM 181602 / DAOM 197198 / MUCL 43194) TaxID=747089 RepID=U9UF33_RHIID
MDKYDDNLKNLVYRSLFEVFIENEGSLHSFEAVLSIEVFDQLNVLESIHLIYCEYLNSDSIQQIIKKFGDCLENFGFGNIDEIIDEYNEPKRQLFEFITKYCKKIRYFESGLPDDNNTYLFIKNNQHNINYLTIEADFHDHYAVYNKYIMKKERVKYLAILKEDFDDKELFFLKDELLQTCIPYINVELTCMRKV